MIKKDELSNPDSCLNKAADDERVFVLRAKDVAAPAAIRAWIAERIWRGKNEPGDAQIIEAEQCAVSMEAERQAMQMNAPAGYDTTHPENSEPE